MTKEIQFDNSHRQREHNVCVSMAQAMRVKDAPGKYGFPGKVEIVAHDGNLFIMTVGEHTYRVTVTETK